MKLELLKSMSNGYLLQAKDAYLTLQGLYEDFCCGPMGARQYKEYFAICDNIAAINKVLYDRYLSDHGGDH